MTAVIYLFISDMHSAQIFLPLYDTRSITPPQNEQAFSYFLSILMSGIFIKNFRSISNGIGSPKYPEISDINLLIFVLKSVELSIILR